METIEINEHLIYELIGVLDAFCCKFEELFMAASKQDSYWMDTQDVCIMLNVSKRTVQSLRASGKLPHSKIGKKCFYKTEDVKKLLKK